MEKLPDISPILLEVIEHFLPIARQVVPYVDERNARATAEQFTWQWLEHEKNEAMNASHKRYKATVSEAS